MSYFFFLMVKKKVVLEVVLEVEKVNGGRKWM
jgi:hypothetical protein